MMVSGKKETMNTNQLQDVSILLVMDDGLWEPTVSAD